MEVCIECKTDIIPGTGRLFEGKAYCDDCFEAVVMGRKAAGDPTLLDALGKSRPLKLSGRMVTVDIETCDMSVMVPKPLTISGDANVTDQD